MKVVFLPLDERPCNYNYPLRLPLCDDFKLVLPPKELLSSKKDVCNLNRIEEWIEKESSDANYLILSFDTLLFGGLIPSRIHNDSLETIKNRSKVIERIKKNNPSIKIFANELIMRCPCYSSSDEEPDYYEKYGYDIFRLGVLTDKEIQEDITKEEIKEKKRLEEKINSKYLNDFLNRRKTNIDVLLNNLEYVKNGIIDFFIIPQDDSTTFGFPSIDQRRVREYIDNNLLHNKIYLYPGGDEVGLTLISRTINDYKEYNPKIYVIYASEKGKNSIPSFEDRPIDVTINYHISATKSIRVNSYNEADIILFINNGSEFLGKYDKNTSISYDKNRCLPFLIDQIEYFIKLGKVVGIGDVLYCNEADETLLKFLKENDLLFKISGYAGWNTASNTLGTVLANLISFYYSRDERKKNLFLVKRYIDDYIYMGKVREKIINYIEGLNLKGINRFNLDYLKKEMEIKCKEEMSGEINIFLCGIYQFIKDFEISFPWNRTFEIDLKIKEK